MTGPSFPCIVEMFYIEACSQVKCMWLLTTYVNEVPFVRIKNIDFSEDVYLYEGQAEITSLFQKLNNCIIKSVDLSFSYELITIIITQSRSIPIVSGDVM